MKKFVFSLMMFGFLFLGIFNESVDAQATKGTNTQYHIHLVSNLPSDYVLPTFWIRLVWEAPQGSSLQSGVVSTKTFENKRVDYDFCLSGGYLWDGTMTIETNLFDVIVEEFYSMPIGFTPRINPQNQDYNILFHVNTNTGVE